MPAKISRVSAVEVQAHRALLALRVTVEADDGSVGVSTPETGVSTGTYEAKFLLDGGERYRGLGVRKAAEVVNTVIEPVLVGIDVTAQGEIDQAMIELDGTPGRSLILHSLSSTCLRLRLEETRSHHHSMVPSA